MALSTGQIARIGESVDTALGDSDLARHLRDAFPGLLVTVCLDDDITGRVEPVHAGRGFNLYLIDGSDHCLALTADPGVAAGVVVAMVDEE